MNEGTNLLGTCVKEKGTSFSKINNYSNYNPKYVRIYKNRK